jgi:hypothetical protein
MIELYSSEQPAQFAAYVIRHCLNNFNRLITHKHFYAYFPMVRVHRIVKQRPMTQAQYSAPVITANAVFLFAFMYSPYHFKKWDQPQKFSMVFAHYGAAWNEAGLYQVRDVV